MTNGTTTIEELEAELARTDAALDELAAAAADIADVAIILGDDDATLFERLSSLGQDDNPVVVVPPFAVAV